MGPSQDTDTIAVQPVSKPQISRGERLFLLGLIAVVLLLSTLPYIAGYYAQTPDRVFIGAVFDKMDYAVHLATMQLGARGEWKYQFEFTSEAHQGAYVKLFYIFLGHVSAWIGLSVGGTYQISRWVFGALALIMIYYWISQTFSSRWVRGLAFLLAVFGSGLGWLQLLIGIVPQADISPIDFWLIDAYIFFGLLVFPHFSAITAILAGMVSGFLSIMRDPAWWKWVLVALMGVLAQFIQPFAPFIADLAMLGAIIWIWFTNKYIPLRILLGCVGIWIAQIPLLLYNAGIFYFDPIWREFTNQNTTLSPPLVYYFWGFGLLWPLAIIGGWKVVETFLTDRDSDKPLSSQPRQISLVMAAVWCAGALILAYGPYGLQRRFMHAFILPLTLLSVHGLSEVIVPWFEKKKLIWLARREISISILLGSLAAISTSYLCFGSMLLLLQRPPGYFESSSLTEAVEWLAENADHDDVVLATEQTSQTVAASTGMTVYYGHPMETLTYHEKRERVQGFFSGNGEINLSKSNIRWVVYGPHERDIIPGGNWTQPKGFQEVYKNKEVTIYRRAP
jgi:hypothetical protein